MQMNAPITIRGVTLAIAGVSAQYVSALGIATDVLDGVDLDVRRGEILGIVGESGSGKTMLALAIMGLLPAGNGGITRGTILFEGSDLVSSSEEQLRLIRGRRIAMIPQDPMTSLNPVLTIGSQLVESIRLTRPVTKAEAYDIGIDLLRSVNLSDPHKRMASYPHQLSGGMRQRVVGAIALASRPEVLIADEPTTSLDATVQLQYLKLLERIQAETGVTIILITHDFGVVARVCHRVAVMYAGKVVEIAEVDRIFSGPAHPYTRSLIQGVPTIDGEVRAIPKVKDASFDGLPTVGCSFEPRCDLAFGRCRVESPPMQPVGAGHEARCWLAGGAQ